MAVFMINICKFNGCGITFPRLTDLIEHIENVHIDYDPVVVEQKEASQPAYIPLSYVLKFFTRATRREALSKQPVIDMRRRLMSNPKTPLVRNSVHNGSESDDDDLMRPSEDSNDSWTTVEEYILRYGVKVNGPTGMAQALGPQDKPYACPVPGCLKRYKNVNGIKYHSKNGHKKDGKVKKITNPNAAKVSKMSGGRVHMRHGSHGSHGPRAEGVHGPRGDSPPVPRPTPTPPWRVWASQPLLPSPATSTLTVTN